MREIEEQVLEMRFDNEEFKRRTKETMSVLDKLKNSLNLSEAAKSFDLLDSAAKNMKFDGIAKGVEMLENRFSMMGIVSMRVVENLTDAMTGKLVKGIRFVQDSIVSGGVRRAMNIENAHFQLQALLKNEKKVQAVMKNASDSVDGTAYAYDEAAKAASMFSASGLKAGKEMEEALKGVVGVAAMTNSEYSSISEIFTTVAGNGRLMGDQLLQLSGRGLNAASTIADYFNKVNSGATKASESVTKSIKELSKGAKVTEADIRELVTKGEISFSIFSSAMGDAFGDSAKKANETFTGAFSNMKSALARIGQGFVSPFVEQNSQVVKLFNVLKDRINDVKKELVFDSSLKNTDALSKRFTDSVLSMTKGLRKFLKHLDVQKPMKIFYNGIDTSINLVKILGNVLDPVSEGFGDVFSESLSKISIDNVLKASEAIKKLTSEFKLSDKVSKDLHDGFKGVFDVAKMLGTGLLKLAQAFVPINIPAKTLSKSLLDLFGSTGRVLTKFTETISKSEQVKKTYDSFASGIKYLCERLSDGIKLVGDFGKTIYGLKTSQKILSTLSKTLASLGEVGYSFVEKLTGRFKELDDELSELAPDGIDSLRKSLEKMDEVLYNLDISKPIEFIKSLSKAFSETQVGQYFLNAMTYIVDTINSFSFDYFVEKINKFRNFIDDFSSWFGGIMSSTFSDLSLGGAVAIGGGVGILSILKTLSDSLKKISSTTSSFKSIPKVFDAVRATLETYQAKLKSEMLINIAKAVAILAASILLLSFADTSKIMESSKSLSLIAAVLAAGFTAIMLALDKVGAFRSKMDPLNRFSNDLGKSMKKLSTAAKYVAIGSMVKSLAISVVLIAGAIAVLSKIQKKNPEGLDGATEVIKKITVALIAFTVLGSLIPSGKGANLAAMSSGVIMVAASLALIVSSLKKLFKMEIPNDAKQRLGMLEMIFVSLAALMLVVGVSSRISGGNTLNAAPILALSTMLIVTISSLKKLFKMDIPNDYATRFGMLLLIFSALGKLMVVISVASRLAGGAISGTGPILAMSVFIVSVVGALAVLSMIPFKKLLPAAVSLGTVLLALGGALALSSKLTDSSNQKSILAMVGSIAAITISLGVLSMVPFDKLTKATASLGLILLAIGAALNQASKTDTKSYLSILAMVLAMGSIALALTILSDQPWEGMLAAAVGISSVMLAMATTTNIISKIKPPNPKSLASMAALLLMIVPIGVSLGLLASQPWEGMLAAAAAISAVMLAFSISMKLISSTETTSTKSMSSFLESLVALTAVTAAIRALSNQPVDGMLVAAAALSSVMLAFTACFAVMSIVPSTPTSMASFLAAIIALTGVTAAIYVLSEKPIAGMLMAAMTITQVLEAMTIAIGVCSLVGAVAPAGLAGIGVLDVFVANFLIVLTALGAIFQNETASKLLNGGLEILTAIGSGIGDFVGAIVAGVATAISSTLPQLGTDLSSFMENANAFFIGVDKLSPETMSAVKLLAETILILTAADLISGLTSWLTGESSLADFGNQLKDFGEPITEFAEIVKDVKPESVKGAAAAAEIMAKVAEKLPAHDGLVQKIFGEKSLKDFGDELTDFGPSIVEFATQVEGVKEGSVKGAAAAAEIMAELANKLPNSGGLVSKILGDNTLSDFGAELMTFAPQIEYFAWKVSNIKAGAVSGVQSITQIMSKLANELPDSGGIVSAFLGDNNISDFGLDLISFGSSMQEFYDSIKEISYENFNNVLGAFERLAGLSTLVSESDSYGIVGFIQGLNDIGDAGITGFLKPFLNSEEKVKQAVKTMIEYATAVSDSENTSFQDKFYNVGVNGVTGFINGLNSKLKKVKETGEKLGRAAHEATKKELDEHSPSRKMFQIGDFAGAGFLNALYPYIKKASKVGKKIGTSTVDSVSRIFTSDSLSPVIRPKLDLDGLNKSAKSMSDILNGSINKTVSLAGTATISTSNITNKESKLFSTMEKMIRKMDDKTPTQTVYSINGLTYNSGDNVSEAIETLAHAVEIKGRV